MKLGEEMIEQIRNRKSERRKKFLFLPLIVLSVIIITAALTTLTLYAQSDSNTSDYEEFEQFFQIYDKLSEEYYEDVDQDALVESAIRGLIEGLDDPYTEYMDASETDEFYESVTGDFEGIGAEVRQEGSYIVIVSPMRGSPAEAAGIEPGDMITAVDGESIEGWTANEAVQLIRGEKGTDVTLTVVRGNNAPTDITITRDTIHVESVTYEAYDDIAHVSINRFQEGTTDEFAEALDEAAENGNTNLVLDFRYNPGGLLNEAVNMINQFVDRNTEVLLLEEGDGQQVSLTTTFDKNDSTDSFENIYIMINEGSASASEVVTGALQDLIDVEVVGTTSFGKGTVQTTEQFSNQALLKYTHSKWLTPSGTWVHDEGIEPDVELINPDFYRVTILNPDELFAEGQENETIISLKVALDALGYEIDEVNETFDSNLTEQVEAFQEDNDLEVTGVVTGETTDTLVSELRAFILDNDAQLDYLIDYINGEYTVEEIEAIADENAQYIEMIDLHEEMENSEEVE